MHLILTLSGCFTAPPPPAPTCPDGRVLLHGTSTHGPPEVQAIPSPAHEVTLSPYCMDVHEVSVGDYGACATAGSCKPLPGKAALGGDKVDFALIVDISLDCVTKPALAVNCVDWEMAQAYCKHAGGALPTEAQWEFAARGAEGRRYPWGGDAPTGEHVNVLGSERPMTDFQEALGKPRAIVGADGFEGVAPPGSHPLGATPDGIHDLGGNVSEWTADWVGPYPSEALTDPTGPEIGAYRVTRGASFYGLDGVDLQGSMRRGNPPIVRDPSIGFRCASGPLEPATD